MRFIAFIAAVFVLCGCFGATVFSQTKMLETSGINIKHIRRDFDIAELNSRQWGKGIPVTVRRYWSGREAPPARHFTARLLWSPTALYVRFTAKQTEPPVVLDKPDLGKKTLGLWDRDVCEVFIAPDPAKQNKYFEFEIAPTGEWIDLGIEARPDKRVTDWDYSSGMRSAVRVEKNKVIMAIRVPWKALGKTPKAGDKWLGNLFRCVGKDPDRGYLAWQPTLTKEPAFHVPEKFGQFLFVD